MTSGMSLAPRDAGDSAMTGNRIEAELDVPAVGRDLAGAGQALAIVPAMRSAGTLSSFMIISMH
jgi:hypothetical protein